MQDVYLMDKFTGELIPSEQVMIEFYKTHNALESVFDYYDETKLVVENSNISFPDFTKTIQI